MQYKMMHALLGCPFHIKNIDKMEKKIMNT